MTRLLGGAVLVVFGACVVVACFEVSPLGGALGLAAYGAVLLVRLARWRRGPAG